MPTDHTYFFRTETSSTHIYFFALLYILVILSAVLALIRKYTHTFVRICFENQSFYMNIIISFGALFLSLSVFGKCIISITSEFGIKLDNFAQLKSKPILKRNGILWQMNLNNQYKLTTKI